jgi:hypothetical protein
VGKPADVFCFGSIMYELIYEAIPWSFDGIDTFEELYKNVVIDKKLPKLLNDESINNFKK